MTRRAEHEPNTERSEAEGRELAPVPDAERWQRVTDLAAAHEADVDLAAGDPDDDVDRQ